jgi:hypothetical protein
MYSPLWLWPSMAAFTPSEYVNISLQEAGEQKTQSLDLV